MGFDREEGLLELQRYASLNFDFFHMLLGERTVTPKVGFIFLLSFSAIFHCKLLVKAGLRLGAVCQVFVVMFDIH